MKNRAGIIIGLVILSIVVVGIVGGLSAMNFSIKSKQLLNGIDGQLTTNKTNYDKMWKKFSETAQVQEKYAKDVKEIYTATIEGRYGNDNSLLFKSITESNPNIDSSIYKQLQTIIDDDRDEFFNYQKTITDKVTAYNNYLAAHPIMSTILAKEDLKSEAYVITSDKTKDAFATGEDNQIDLFKDEGSK